MRAIVLRRVGGPEALVPETVPDPTPGPDDVLVRVRAAAVCGRDLIDRRGGFPMMKLPTILGHELAGEVVALGERARDSGFQPGDRVVNLHRPSCGACRRCVAGHPIDCERAFQSFGHTVDGAYAELVAAHHRTFVRLPEDMGFGAQGAVGRPGAPNVKLGFEAAATLMCTAGVALRALRTRARLTLGETVLITGASGGVGTMAVQLARRLGARVIATTTQERKVAALRRLGAHEVVVSPDARFHSRVLALSDGGADVAVELTGSATFSGALRSLRRGGRMVVVGNIEAAKVEINLGAVIVHGYEIVGSASCTHQDLTDVLGLVRAGEIAPVIDRTLPLEQAAEAHRLLADRAVVGRVVLVP